MIPDEFYERAKESLFPKMENSDVCVSLYSSKPDPKLCMEIGAAIMFNKPIILMIRDRSMLIPTNLLKVASKIVYGAVDDPTMVDRLQAAIREVLAK